MPAEKTHYEILGLTRAASITDIKKRYRELARKYHPDVVADKAAGEKTFVTITEAYKTLVDPEKRRAYDATLIDMTRQSPPRTNTYSTVSATARPRPTQTRPQVAKLIKDAEYAFIRRRFGEATELCREAIRIDRTCARAHAILGDIYRSRKLYESAINEYNYAVQYDPTDHESAHKLEKLIGRSEPVTFTWEDAEGRLSNQAIILNMIGWSLSIFVLLLINMYPGEPIPWLSNLPVPFELNWSWNLVGILFGDAALVGLLLGINGVVDDPDDELIFDSGGRGWGIIPTGLLLLVFSPIFFLGAAAFYLLVGFMQDTISKSVSISFAAVAAIVLIAALMYPIDKMSVMLLGGNVAFVGVLAGWYVGSILRT